MPATAAVSGVTHASCVLAGDCTTIGEYAVSEPSLSSFVETLKVAGIFENAQDPPEPHTILAPNNDAFAAIADVAAGLDPAGLLDVCCSPVHHRVAAHASALQLIPPYPPPALS